MYSNNKQIRDVAAVAAQIMSGQKPVEEELKGGQVKLDKNHNNKLDSQDFKILRGEKKTVKEEDAYDKDRYAVKDGKAVKDNPAHMGSKDEPHHVWATSADEALKKKMKEDVELEEGKWNYPKEITGKATDDDHYLGNLSKKRDQRKEWRKTVKAKAHKDLMTGKSMKKEDVEQIDEKKYEPEPPNAEAIARKKRLDAIRDRQEEKNRGNKSTSNVRKVEGNRYGGGKQKDEMDESVTFTGLLNTYRQGGLKPFLESLSREEEEQLIDELSKEIADETMEVINAGDYAEATIGEEADTAEFAQNLETNKAKASGKTKQPNLAKGDVIAVKNEEVEQVEERHMTDAEMNKRETIVKSMKKGLSGFKQRYGERAKNVMYATATKQAMK